MIPIGMLIQRKTLVPTKRQIKHMYRSDWKSVCQINYFQSPHLLRRLSGFGMIETEGQFAKWIFDNFGPGEYTVRAWRKQRKGFWLFLHIICYKEGFFKRVEKGMSKEEKQKRETMTEYRKLKARLGEAEGAEKERIQEDLRDLQEDIEILEFNPDDMTDPKRGPAPYLKSALPLYREHEYEDYGKRAQTAQSPSGGFW